MSKSGKPNFMNKPLFQSPLSKPLDIYALPNLSKIYYDSNEKMGDSLKQKQNNVSNIISSTIKQSSKTDSIRLPEYPTLQPHKALSPAPEYHYYDKEYNSKVFPYQCNERAVQAQPNYRYTPYTIVHNGPINYHHLPSNGSNENNPNTQNTLENKQNHKPNKNSSIESNDGKHAFTYRAGSNNIGSRALIDSYEYGIQRRDGVLT